MTERPTPWISRLSRLEKPISGFGILLLVAAIGYGYYELSDLNRQIADLTKKQDNLEKSIPQLNAEIDKLKNAPVRDLVKPRAIAVELPGQRDPQSRQLYNYTLWLGMPASRKKDISKVEYFFNDPSMRVKTHIGSEPSNSFAVSYKGWGCFDDVRITIDSPGSVSPPIVFDMCKAIDQSESHSGPT